MAKTTVTKKHEKGSVGEYAEAYEKTAKARAALTPSEMLPINLDVELTLATTFAALSRLTAFRDTIVKELPKFDIAEIDNLGMYAEALGDAQSTYLTASQPVEPLPELAASAMERRELLLTDATALAKRGFFDARKLQELKGGPGYLNIASDLGALAKLFREHWETVSAKTAVQLSEIEEAEAMRKRISVAYGERSQPSAMAAASSDDRQRAYTLLVRAYDQARRAILYLRWNEGDGDKIAPSLWAGRGGRSSSSNTAPTTNAPGGSTTAPGDGSPKPVAPDASNAAHEAPQTHASGPSIAGLPGGSPFTSN